ncbi:MAG: hypothetical protein P1P64_00485 [Treponemataceae bacterium]
MKQVKKIFLILVLVGFAFSCKTVDKSAKTDTAKSKYQTLAETLTEECPIKEDEDFQIDYFKFDEAKSTFWIYMRFLDLEKKDYTDEELSVIKDMFTIGALAGASAIVDDNPDFASFKEDKINTGFACKDENGVELFDVIVEYDEY